MFFRSIFKQLPLFAGIMASSMLPFICKEKEKHEVYLWGNGIYQARPDALLQFKNFTPKKITNLPDNLVKLEFGEYYQAGLDDKNNLYIWRSQKMDSNLQQESTLDNERQQIHLLSKNIKQVKFTTGYIWTLNSKDQVIQYPIIKEFDKNNQIKKVKLGKSRSVDPLKGSIQICAGNDHVISLNAKGEVFVMGDDTYGQCGMDNTKRNAFPPFPERRVSYPVKEHLKNIKKIAAGGYHCLALDESGSLFGWGSNSSMQLSHQQQFSQMNTPLICSVNPIKISKGLDNSEIVDIRAGEQFSVILTQNKLNSAYQVFTCGSNLKGQLGIGQIRHVRDITKVQALSDFIFKRNNKQVKVAVDQIHCGKKHCIALLNIGYIMEWGDNEQGQMGNKKRSSVYSPIIIRQFSQKDILGVFAGENQSGVILRSSEANEKSQTKSKDKK